jgi:hypothetical protein
MTVSVNIFKKTKKNPEPNRAQGPIDPIHAPPPLSSGLLPRRARRAAVTPP